MINIQKINDKKFKSIYFSFNYTINANKSFLEVHDEYSRENLSATKRCRYFARKTRRNVKYIEANHLKVGIWYIEAGCRSTNYVKSAI